VRAKELLRDNGFKSWADMYIHQDGSGTEIPSPILRGAKGLLELKKVMELLVDNDATVTAEDGLHVHHDAPEFVDDDDLTMKLVETWSANREHISKFVSEYRRGNYWACYADYWNEHKIAQIKSGSIYRDGDDAYKNKPKYFSERFAALNISSLDEHGTIEIRQHEGTLNFNHAAAWVYFGQAFLETVKKRKTILTCADSAQLLSRTKTAKVASLVLMDKVANPVFPEGHEYAGDDDYYGDGDDGYCCEDCNGSGW
jgi:hypothetical protein